GLTIVSSVTPADFLDGSFASKDLLRLGYSRVVSPANPISFAANGGLDYSFSGVNVELDLGGTVTVDPALTFSMQFGLDATRGPFVVEGASINGALPVTGTLNGGLDIGALIGINVTGAANFATGMSYVMSDFDPTPNEKFYLGDVSVGALIVQHPQAIAATGNLTIDMQLTADTPADDLPVIGKYIAGALSWDASATYDLATGNGAYEIVEDTLPSFANFERQIRDDFLTMVDQYNPLPQEFRDFLTMDIDFFAGQSIADMIGLGDAEILLNPLKFKGQQDVDVNQQDGGEHIELLYTFTEPQNIIAMLTGKTVDFFRLDIDKTFADAQIEFPVVPETPVASFFGIVNVTLEVNVQVGFAFAL
ncbi:MAG: hypothetical protein KDA55_14680, partial [Planctomycetales bacterium]|nr:hypothetical protein [Planctomycetales bacterium]